MAGLSDEQWNNLYHIVGLTTVHWAFIERFMDDCIVFIYNEFDGKLIPKNIPKTKLSLKIELLKIYFDELPKLSKFKDMGLHLINNINDFSSKRHWLVHGVIMKATTDILHLTKYEYGQAKHKIEKFEPKFSDLANYAKALQDLTSEFALLAQRIAEDAMFRKHSLK